MRAKGYVEPKVEEVVKIPHSKFQKPTTEEMRLAQLLDDKQQDIERENIILEVMEATSRIRDDVIIALHDCNYDPVTAIEVLMDHGDLSKEEWHECGVTKKKKRPVHAEDNQNHNSHDDGLQNVSENPQTYKSGNRRSRSDKDRLADNKEGFKQRDRRPNKAKDDRRSRTVGERHPLSGSNADNASELHPNESESHGNQKLHHRRNMEPGAEETNEILTRRGGGRGGSSARGRSWYGGSRNGGETHYSGRGHANGVGRGRYADRHQSGHSENTGFTMGTWENSESGKGDSGNRRRHGGSDDWDIDEWDGSLTQTFERSNNEVVAKPSYGAIGVKPGQNEADTGSPGPVRVTLDSVMNVAGTRRENTNGAKSKSPRRDVKETIEPKAQRKSPIPRKLQMPKSAQDPPVVILDNRPHVADSHGPVGLRFGSGLDSIGLNVPSSSGNKNEDSSKNLSKAAKQSPQSNSSQSQQPRQQTFPTSPQQHKQQTSPQKRQTELSGEKVGGAFSQRGITTSQRQLQDQAPPQQFRPPSSTGTHLSKAPAGLDPSLSQQRNQSQSPYQQQQQQQQQQSKVNGDQSFGGQSQQQQPQQSIRTQAQQPQQQPSSVPPSLILQQAAASSAQSQSSKLAESMGKLNVQDVKSPQRGNHSQPQPPQQQQQPPTSNPAGMESSSMRNFTAVPHAYAMAPPPSGTVPYYFPQFSAGQQNNSSQQSNQQQPQTSQPATSNSSSVSDYFNSSDVNNLYQRTLLEQQQQQSNQQNNNANSASSSNSNNVNKSSQESRNVAPDQLLNPSSNAPPHSTATGMPPGGVPPAFLTPQLFYPLMQLFAANPTLMAPFLAQPQPQLPPGAAGDLKSQAQFLQAVGMPPFMPYPQQQQQQQSGTSHPGEDLPGAQTGSHSAAGPGASLVVGHPPQDSVSAVGQQHQQSHQHQQQAIRPPPGFLLPVRQSNSGINMAPTNNNDANMSGFRAYQQQQQDKGPSGGVPPGLFGQGGPNAGQAAFLAGAGQPGRQQPGGVAGMKPPQQSHMQHNPYNWTNS